MLKATNQGLISLFKKFHSRTLPELGLMSRGSRRFLPPLTIRNASSSMHRLEDRERSALWICHHSHGGRYLNLQDGM